MADTLHRLDPNTLIQEWIEVLLNRLRGELDRSAPGHCLRLADLPRSILEPLAEQLNREAPPGAEIYLVDRMAGPEPWRVGVHKVVERRNAEESAILALFPPDLQLAAGDSVDVSTFRVIPVNDLPRAVEDALLTRLPTTQARQATAILDYLTRHRWPLTASDRLNYLAALVQQDRDDPVILGGALYTLGLIPDFELLHRPEAMNLRLGHHNIRIVQRLQQEGTTPLERALRLPLADEAYRGRLIDLFREWPPDGVHAWGEVVATSPEYRDYSLDRWPLGQDSEDAPGSVRIDIEPLKLARRAEDGLLKHESGGKVMVAWRTTPKPVDVPELEYFRIELLDADRVVVWETPLIKRGTGTTDRRSKTIANLATVDSGIHFFRVIAVNAAGDLFPEQPLRDPDNPGGKRVNESDDFLLVHSGPEVSEDDTDFQPVANISARSYPDAETLARGSGAAGDHDARALRKYTTEWVTPLSAGSEAAAANIRFDLQRQYTVKLSQRLRRLEVALLAAPETGGHFVQRLGMQATPPEPCPLTLPSGLAEARHALFQSLRTPDGDSVVVLADLCALAAPIETYARTYLDWLHSGDAAALRLDVTRAELPEYGEVALVSPTHPLRLLWLLQEHQLAWVWAAAAAERKVADRSLLELWRNALSAQGIPPFLILSGDAGYLDAGPLPGGWGAYLPPRRWDSRAVLSLLRSRLGAGAAHTSEADVPPRLLADKLELFLRQHAYTPVLILNVINPGDAALVVDALVDLEKRPTAEKAALRYEVRLFTDASHRESIGTAFRDLVDPERPISAAAERLVGPGRSFLFPKLTWSRNSLQDFLNGPSHYPAHVTLLLDTFHVSLEVERFRPQARTSFVHGLVQEAARRYAGRGSTYRWVRRPAPAPCPELAAAPGRSALMAELLSATGALQGRILAPSKENVDLVPVASLDLATSGQSLLYSAHASSTWVLTVDPHLGLDYFDAAGSADRPGYLLDFTPEFVASGGRQLLLTTRIGGEVSRIMQPALDQLDLDAEGAGALFLMEALRSLSGRLALRLLSSPSQVQGALGMALARLFLEGYDLLRETLVIPLDAHPELVKSSDPLAPQLRGDLLLVSSDAVTRQLDFLIIEAKCYGGSGLGSELRATITAQLQHTEKGLREAFDPDAVAPDRLDRVMQSWRLSGVLGFYLDRAARYSLVSAENLEAIREFFADLDRGYGLSVRKMGLVFHPEATDTELDQQDPDIPIWIVGKDVIQRLVTDGLRRYGQQEEGPSALVEPALRTADTPPQRPTLEGHPSWERVRTSFTESRHHRPETASRLREPERPLEWHTGAGDGDETSPGEGRPAAGDPSAPGEPERVSIPPPVAKVDASTDAGPRPLQDSTGSPERIPARPDTGEDRSPAAESSGMESSKGSTAQGAEAGHPGPASPEREHRPDEAPGVEHSVLLGDTRSTPQYGLIGSVATEPWRRVALDLNGCNTLSVFGVQGSGKSYTVGAILEMAVQSMPAINVLPRPLGAVVFHYHQTQDYPPEFVSMDRPNDDKVQIQALAELGARPLGLTDVLVLTTSDTVELRSQEFPRAQIEPIAFASAELTVADWRFLMGASGNDALYLKVVNEVMRQSRAHLTLQSIRDGLAQAPLSTNHRELAETRLNFAARFIDDSRSLRSLFRPGRLVVVDLRDEFIEKEEALGLFVTMLNVFSGAGLGGDPFNKLIVFDEAHKYMSGSIISHVVEVIREMRHKGVTAVIASQDPINVPPAVIELSSAVVLHRFNSPNWLKHIQKSVSALAELTPSMLASLAPGEAFLWANRATDPTFMRRPVKLRMRPRVTKHGGATRTALDD